jgi:hypothetical protein
VVSSADEQTLPVDRLSRQFQAYPTVLLGTGGGSSARRAGGDLRFPDPDPVLAAPWSHRGTVEASVARLTESLISTRAIDCLRDLYVQMQPHVTV